MTALLLVFAACDSTSMDDDGEPDFITQLVVTPNPSGYAPLTAEIALATSRPVQVELLVPGRGGDMTDVRHRFEGLNDRFTLPVVGLYPGETTVILLFFDENGAPLGDLTRSVTSSLLISDMPEIAIDAADPAGMKPGMNLVSYFGHNGEFRPMKPFIFDAAGDIRWYLDLRTHPSLNDLFYDNGIERLANGNLFFGDQRSERIVEMDLLGRIVNEWAFPGYEFHHHVLEKPDGNFVVTVTRLGAPTIEDYVIEIDRASGDVIREWDLNQSLQYSRRAWPTSFADLEVDWFHGNGLAYDPSDDTIVVSGRTQGTVKLTSDNEVVWILAPHRDWGVAGNGVDLNTKLLHPLDASGQPIDDPDVLDGAANHPDFEWAWYQHAPELMPDGALLLFDNGDHRNYADEVRYSRAVAYRIDPAAMTIQQVWQYGKERGTDTYSRIVSDVDYHEREDNILFLPGAAGRDATPYGKVIEIDRASRSVVFEATITAPTAQFGITYHRVERLPWYPASPQ